MNQVVGGVTETVEKNYDAEENIEKAGEERAKRGERRGAETRGRLGKGFGRSSARECSIVSTCSH